MDKLQYVWAGMTSLPVFIAAMGGVLWGMFGGALPGIWGTLVG